MHTMYIVQYHYSCTTTVHRPKTNAFYILLKRQDIRNPLDEHNRVNIQTEQFCTAHVRCTHPKPHRRI